MIVISDTSPLRYLVALGLVDLMPRRFGELLVPPEVADECRHSAAPEALRRFVLNAPGWFSIAQAPPRSISGLGRLDPGESAAIRLALAKDADLLLIDERIGRQVAVDADIRVSGTLGLLADAAERGWLDFDMTVQRLVTETNFRVSPEVIGAVRRLLERTGAR